LGKNFLKAIVFLKCFDQRNFEMKAKFQTLKFMVFVLSKTTFLDKRFAKRNLLFGKGFET